MRRRKCIETPAPEQQHHRLKEAISATISDTTTTPKVSFNIPQSTEARALFEKIWTQDDNKTKKANHAESSVMTAPGAIHTFLNETLPRKIPIIRHYVEGAPFSVVDVQELDNKFVSMACHVFVTWATFTILAFTYTPHEHIVYLQPSQQKAHLVCAILLVTNVISKTSPIFLNTAVSGFPCFSGSFMAGMTVQCIAAMTDLMSALCPIPVIVDSITGCEVSLLRWTAWVPLGYAMAFLTDGIDATIIESPLWFGFTNGLSCFVGGVLAPLVGNYMGVWGPLLWGICFTMSCFLFLLQYLRLYYKQINFPLIQKGNSVEEMETYERFRIGLNLLRVCAFSWSFLVLNYIVAWILQVRFGGQWSLNMITEPFFDVLSKNFYLNLNIEAHQRIFDDKARSERRLEELRRFISIVWNTSTDLMVISIGGINGDVKTQLSPALEKLIRAKTSLPPQTFELMLKASELKQAKANLEQGQKMVSSTSGDQEMTPKKRSYKHIDDHQGIQEASGIRELVLDAWINGNENERVFSRCLVQQDGAIIHCEAKVTRLNKYSLIMVVRDITERYQRFEAEKKVVSLVTARKKDEEANKFTRHEVKNGILAAIGLCDGISDSINEAKEKRKQQRRRLSGDMTTQLFPATSEREMKTLTLPYDDFTEKVDDLGITLQETLNMVITETVARDLINGVYAPRYEPLNLRDIFARRPQSDSRFSVEFSPPDNIFPKGIILDPQILRYIHQNAFTNACKYGKKGGTVRTVFHYNATKEMLEMSVINEPGHFHDRILKLGSHAKALVFTPGKRLHTTVEDTSKVRLSSGDGAWIMKNCARALNGNCDYCFEVTRTVFTFVCPAKQAVSKERNLQSGCGDDSAHMKIFPLPPQTWGIAIDDSKVQRKLLNKLLLHTGLVSERIIVQGGTAQEIQDFDRFVIDLVNKNPRDLFLIIVDENMDTAEDEKLITISGSMLAQNIIRALPPKLEKRILTLVRSANDSSSDIAMYESRAHGFLNKAPVIKNQVEKVLAPLWINRFGGKDHTRRDSEVSLGSGASTEDVAAVPSADEEEQDETNMEEMDKELQNSVDRINVLIKSRDDYSWMLVKELLHSLKGDLMTYSTKKTCLDAMDLIDMIRHSKSHDDFVAFKWEQLKELMTVLVRKLQRGSTDEQLERLCTKM